MDGPIPRYYQPIRASGSISWPVGIAGHTARSTKHSSIMAEVWESRDDQDEFMNTLLALSFVFISKPPPASVARRVDQL
jgi:hypothetical protein